MLSNPTLDSDFGNRKPLLFCTTSIAIIEMIRNPVRNLAGKILSKKDSHDMAERLTDLVSLNPTPDPCLLPADFPKYKSTKGCEALFRVTPSYLP